MVSKWWSSKARGISKRGFELFLSFFHRCLKRFYHKPQYEFTREWSDLFTFMVKYEKCPKMKQRWNELSDLSSLLIDDDGAYAIRTKLFLWRIVDRYPYLCPSLIEAEVLRKEMYKRGLRKEAKRFYKLAVNINMALHDQPHR